ncbi:MAG: hypothetical protein AAFZ07_18295 [Actinomycetota bacterium]
MEDDGNAFFDAIIDFFRATVEVGESWGDPWGVVFPLAVVLFFAVLLIGGLQSVAGSLDKQVRPWFGLVIILIAVLVFAALNSERLSADDSDPDPGVVPATTAPGG